MADKNSTGAVAPETEVTGTAPVETIETVETVETPPDTTGAETGGDVDPFADWTPAEIRRYVTDRTIPERFRGDDTEAATEADAGETEVSADAEPDEAAAIEAETPPPPVFTKLPGADDWTPEDEVTFRAEADRYLEQVELTPELEAILRFERDRADTTAAIVQQYETVGDFEAVSKAVGAINALIEFRQTADGEFRASTDALRDYLKTEFPVEHRHLMEDFLTEPSPKYRDLTVFQEWLKDGFSLSDSNLATIQQILETGALPSPQFVPPGIDPKAAEAYWHSPDREKLQADIDEAAYVLRDATATEAEKAEARAAVETINQKLRQIQFGFDAQRRQRDESQAQAEAARRALEETATTGFFESVSQLSNQLSGQISAALGFVEGPAARTVADGIVTLVRGAYSEREWEARHHRELLKERGIVHDWNKGRHLLDRLADTETKIAALEANARSGAQVNPRAIEAARRDKLNILRELSVEQKEIAGRVVKSVAAGQAKTLEKKLAAAPKVAAVRQRIAGSGTMGAPRKRYEELTDDQLRDPAIQRELRSAAAKVLFGGNPAELVK